MSSERDLNLPITSEDFTRPATDSAGRNFDKLQGKVDGFSTKKPQKEVEDFGKLITAQAKDGESAFTALGRAIDVQKDKISSLKAKAKSDGGASIFGDLKAAKADLESLIHAGEDAGMTFVKDGEKAGSSFMKGLSSATEDLGPAQAALIGVAIGSAPAIGATIAAAVAAGFGLGIIGVGALSLKNNPALTAAAGDLKADVADAFSTTASPLLGPLVDGVHELDNLIKDVKPELSSLFTAAAPAIGPLVDGIDGFVKGALPKFVDGMQGAEPVVEALADNLPRLGSTIGDVVDKLSNSPGTINAVNIGFTALDTTIEAVVDTVTFLGKAFDVVTYPGREFGKVAGTLTAYLRSNKDVTGGVTLATQAMTGVTGRAALAQTDYASAIRAANVAAAADLKTEEAVFDMRMKLTSSLIALKQSQDDLTASIKKNGDNWSLNTQKGRDNTTALDDAIQKNKDYFDAQVKLHGESPKLVAAYDAQLDKLLAIAAKGGDSASAIANLKKQYQLLYAALKTLDGKHFSYQVTGTVKGGGAPFVGVGNADSARFAAGTSWNPAAAGGLSSEPARVPELTAMVTSNFILDGQVIDRRVSRTRLQERHGARVGRRLG